MDFLQELQAAKNKADNSTNPYPKEPSVLPIPEIYSESTSGTVDSEEESHDKLVRTPPTQPDSATHSQNAIDNHLLFRLSDPSFVHYLRDRRGISIIVENQRGYSEKIKRLQDKGKTTIDDQVEKEVDENVQTIFTDAVGSE